MRTKVKSDVWKVRNSLQNENEYHMSYELNLSVSVNFFTKMFTYECYVKVMYFKEVYVLSESRVPDIKFWIIKQNWFERSFLDSCNKRENVSLVQY